VYAALLNGLIMPCIAVKLQVIDFEKKNIFGNVIFPRTVASLTTGLGGGGGVRKIV
jgi:hypothetical protein